MGTDFSRIANVYVISLPVLCSAQLACLSLISLGMPYAFMVIMVIAACFTITLFKYNMYQS